MASREARAVAKAHARQKLDVALHALSTRMNVPTRPQAYGRHDEGMHQARLTDWLAETIVLAAGHIHRLESRIQELERQIAQQDVSGEPDKTPRARKN
jgi:hypothetical protein